MKLDEKVHLIPVGPISFWDNIYSAVYAIVDKNITLIDTGLPTSWEEFILPYIEKIDRSPEEISMIVCTHSHIDHIGSNRLIKKLTKARIAMCDLAFEDSRNPGFLKKRFREKYKKYLTEDEEKIFLEEESEIENAIVDIGLRDNDLLNIEGLLFRVIHTPGHTEDSICLYNAQNGWLFTGDSVQGGGTFPPRSFVQDVRQYLTSLNKLKYLKINKLMAGHAFIPFDPRSNLPVFDEKKAAELIEFSISRTERTREAIMDYVSGKTVSALEVSKLISNFILGSEDQAKIFRTSALVYLKNLEETGWVKTTEKKGRIYFTKN